jgi:hypothetical protein
MTVHQWRSAPTKGRAATVTLSGTADGPTPEQLAKGSFTVAKATGAAINSRGNPLDHAKHFRKITPDMHTAGVKFLKLRTKAKIFRDVKAQRDSLDFGPRGGGDTPVEIQVQTLERDAKCKRFMDRTGPGLYAAAESFVVDGISQGKFDMRYRWWQATHAALRALQEFFQGAK